MIATALLAVGKGDPHYVVAYMVALGIVAVFCTLLMRQRETEPANRGAVPVTVQPGRVREMG
jgi:hypothetical protein